MGGVTITAYGSWFYAFGLIVALIHEETGWSLTFLSAVFAAAQIINGLGASPAGRLLDRAGGRAVFGLQAVFAGIMLVSSWATNPVVFGVLYAVGAGGVGATGFYHVTTAAASRLGPGDPARSIAVLTAIGAFCSPIYLPAGAWLIQATDWRTGARVFAGLAIVGALLTAVVANGGSTPEGQAPSEKVFKALGAATRDRQVRRMLAGYSCAGFSFAALLVYQVPILTDTGIAFTTAAVIGGARGFMQLFGRLGIVAAAARHGATVLLTISYVVAAAGSLLLLTGSVIAGFGYAVLVGVGLGASTPLQAIHARDLFDSEDLGMLMGMQQTVLSLAGGLGPLAAGIVADLAGSQRPTVVLACVSLVASAWLIRPPWSTLTTSIAQILRLPFGRSET